MPISLNDNLRVLIDRPMDSKWGPYTGLADVASSILESERYQGLTVGISGDGKISEYWYRDNIYDLVLKGIDLSNNLINNLVYTTGDQTISGLKDFTTRPTVNGTGVLLSGDSLGPSEITFTGDLNVVLAGGKTFGKYLNGQTIPASGKTPSEVIKLAIVENINPTVNLSVSPSSIIIGESNVNNELTFSFAINNPGASLMSANLEWKRENQTTWTNLATNPASPFLHTNANLVSNNNAYNYRYVITDSTAATSTNSANVSFLYGNYFGYSPSTSLTTVAQIEALGNEILSNSKVRTVNNVTAGSSNYTYYAYNAAAGNLAIVTLDGNLPITSSWTKQATNINGINSKGASVSYIVYRSTIPGAYTNRKIDFT